MTKHVTYNTRSLVQHSRSQSPEYSAAMLTALVYGAIV